MSLVLWSPSTLIRLNDPPTARRMAACSASRSTAKSVATKQNIVAFIGWIIPVPFEIPPSVMGRPPMSTRTAASLGWVSVVMIPSAACRPPWGDRAFTSFGRPARILSMGRGRPMTPVEATRTRASGMRSCLATISVISRASRRPCSPVATLEQPLLATIAWTTPPRSRSRDTLTGAPTT